MNRKVGVVVVGWLLSIGVPAGCTASDRGLFDQPVNGGNDAGDATAGAGGEGIAGHGGSGVGGSPSAGGAGGSKGGTGGSGGNSTGGWGGEAAKGGEAGIGGTSGAGGTGGGDGGAGGAAGTGGGAGGGTAGASGTCSPTPPSTCKTFPQCGCPPDQNCDVTTTAGKAECVPAGQVPPYYNCSTSALCGIGFACVGGVCRKYCSSQADCPGPNWNRCRQVMDGQNPVPGMEVCTRHCNPINPQDTSGDFSACGPNTQCVWVDDGITDCAGPAGTKGHLAACTYSVDCKPGFICVNASSNYVCLQWCTGSTGCPSNLQCAKFTTPLYVGNTEYGICYQ